MDFKKIKFDIIIQGGQSNAEGTGSGPVSEEYVPSENIWYLNAEKTVEIVNDNLVITYADKPFVLEIAKEHGEVDNPIGDFSLTFCKEYEKSLLKADRRILVLRVAIGGAGFKKGQWGIGKQLYTKLVEMTDYALSLNEENRVVAFLWHQGEHDSFEKNDPEIFKAALRAQVDDVRARYGKDIPFIAGDFVNEWKSKNLADCEPILQKINEVIEEGGNGAFVQTSDLLSNNQKIGNGDDIHFCRESLHILGRRYFVAYQEMLNDQKNNLKRGI